MHNTDASSGKEAHPLQYSSQAMATRTTFASASSLYASSRPSVYDPSAYANAPPPPVAAPILSATSNGYRSKQGAVHALIQAPSGHPSVTFPPYYGHSTETISFDDAASLQAGMSFMRVSACLLKYMEAHTHTHTPHSTLFDSSLCGERRASK